MPDSVGPVSAPGLRLRWTVVVPVKRLDVAKSRLARDDRADVALAMALDTVRGARAASVGPVLVVTDDDRLRALISAWAVVVPDRAGAGLNAALAHGAAEARRTDPGCAVAALAGDVPALQGPELRTALLSAEGCHRAIVGDAAGTGTVLLTATPGHDLAPVWGGASRRAHTASGAVDLTDALGEQVPGLRRDVDTLDDLEQARLLGVGPATALLP